MFGHVRTKAVSLFKSMTTFSAHVWRFSGVYSHVHFQITVSPEPLLAHLTNVVSFSRVYLNVSLARGARFKPLVTCGALV